MDEHDLLESINTIEAELAEFDSELGDKERWLVLNKIDTIDNDHIEAIVEEIQERLELQRPLYKISAVTGEGCKALTNNLMKRLLEIEEENKNEKENLQSNPETSV